MKQMKVDLTIPVNPADLPKQSVRARVCQVNGKSVARTYTDPKKKQTQLEIRDWLLAHRPPEIDLDAQKNAYVSIDLLEYRFIAPLSLKRWQKDLMARNGNYPKNTRPDLIDNLFKNLGDALSGTIYYDDARVWRARNITKTYGPEPFVHIALTITWEEK